MSVLLASLTLLAFVAALWLVLRRRRANMEQAWGNWLSVQHQDERFTRLREARKCDRLRRRFAVVERMPDLFRQERHERREKP